MIRDGQKKNSYDNITGKGKTWAQTSPDCYPL